MSDRYFDETLQAWITVCRPGAAKGILTVEGFRGAKRGKQREGKGFGQPTKPEPRPWTGNGKRKRTGAR